MTVHLALLNELMGIVPNAADHGPLIDHMLEVCHWFMLTLFIGWLSFFLYTIFRFHRSRNPKANYHGVKSKASAHLEFMVVIIEAVLLLGFGIPLWAQRVNDFPDEEKLKAQRVRAIGEQFAWNFHYPGADGVFGRQHARFVNPNNPVGLDPEDPSGKDDLVTKNEVHLKNHVPTVIEISSKDVIHSFSVHHMRSDQDATPGLRVPMWFRPIKSGQYEIVCAQLCGAGHYAMKAQMVVDEPEAYETWLKETTDLQHPPTSAPAAPAEPGAAPAAPAAQ